MELRKGYKQTEVGVIPEDWSVFPLSKVIESLDAGVSVNSVNEELKTYGHEQVILKTSSVNAGQFIPQESKKIAPQDIKRAKLNPQADTIIISRMNTPDLVGECGYVAVDYPNHYIPDRLWMTRKHHGSTDCIRWLNYVLSSKPYRSILRGLATGSSGSMKNIGKDTLLSLQLAYPSNEEQRAIATVLSDVDALLDGLDRLIAKKHDLKQAAMQQLLTGQTRLPEFKGEWKVTRLGDLGATYGGLTGKTKSDFGEGEARYITFMNVMTNIVIDTGTLERVRVVPTEPQNRVRKGDLFFNGSSETPEEVALCAVLLKDVKDVYLNSFCFGFRLWEGTEVDGVFLAYYLRSKEGRELMKSLAQGSTRYNISKAALLNSSIRLPGITEQTTIASVLSDMDTEIEALEQRRKKTKNIKHAMMQELLTGRTRLI